MTKRNNNILLRSAQDTDLKETYLSIQIYLDGFSFCIYHPKNQKYIAFESFQFDEKQKAPEQLLKEFQIVFDENELLNRSYQKITIIHQNELSTVVPLEYFNEENLKDYLKNTVKVLPIDYISYDTLKNNSANVVYIPFVNINNFLFQKFGEFDFYHSSTLLIDLLQEKQKNAKDHKVYINVSLNNFELVVFDKKELILQNNFVFQTAEDFIYYILFSLEQLELDTDTVDCEFLGDIEKESELYQIAYKYIRNVDFYSTKNPQLSEEFETLSKHSNFILLNYPQQINS